MRPRLLLVLLGAAVAFAGLAWGAEAQKEVYLAPDPQTQQLERGQPLGNPIPLTGLIAAAGFTVGAVALAPPLPPGRVPAWLRRAPPTALLLAAAYVGINLFQTAFPHVYHGDISNHPGETSIRLPYVVGLSLLHSDSAILSGGLVAPMALILLCLMGSGFAVAALWQARRAWTRPPMDATRLLHRQLGAIATAVPFLAAAASAAVRLLVALPATPEARPYLLVLPLACLCVAGLAGLALLKAFQVSRAAAEPRLSHAAADAWQGLGRVELGLLGLLLLLSVSAAVLPNVAQASDLLVDRAFGAFGLSLPSFVALLAVLVVPLAPLAMVHAQGAAAMRSSPAAAPGPAAAPMRPWWAILAGTGAAFLVAALAAFHALGPLDDGALRGWIASLAFLLPGLLLLRPRPAVLPSLMAAAVLWGMGNTYRLTYQPNPSALPDFEVGPGALMLWNLAAAVLAASAVARVARASAIERGNRATASAVGLGVCLVVVAILELPLSAWVSTDIHGQTLAVGSALASQDGSVRTAMHLLALASSLCAAVLALRMLAGGAVKPARHLRQA